jgi:hypothetical protein
MRHLAAIGWNGVVPHFRGCSGEPNRLPRAYHAGDADEIGWILARLAARHPGAPRYAAGVSWAATPCSVARHPRRGLPAHRRRRRHLPPLDLAAAGHHLATSTGLYPPLPRHPQANAAAKLRQHPGLFDPCFGAGAHPARVRQPRHRPAARRRLLAARLQQAAAGQRRRAHAGAQPRNDPFLPAGHLPGPADVAPAVLLEQPAEAATSASSAAPGPASWTGCRSASCAFSRKPAKPDRHAR